MKRVRRRVRVSVIPGEPTDGTGRICIHLFVRDPDGIIVEPHVLHQSEKKGEFEARSTRGRLACDPKRGVAPVTVGGITTVTMRTDDPRAVSCPKCVKSADYESLMRQQSGMNQ